MSQLTKPNPNYYENIRGKHMSPFPITKAFFERYLIKLSLYLQTLFIARVCSTKPYWIITQNKLLWKISKETFKPNLVRKVNGYWTDVVRVFDKSLVLGNATIYGDKKKGIVMGYWEIYGNDNEGLVDKW